MKALKTASGPNCDGCSAGLRAIRDLYKKGGHLEGGAYQIRIKDINVLEDRTGTTPAFEALVVASTSDQLQVGGDGSTMPNEAATSEVVIVAAWLKSRWQLEALEVR